MNLHFISICHIWKWPLLQAGSENNESCGTGRSKTLLKRFWRHISRLCSVISSSLTVRNFVRPAIKISNDEWLKSSILRHSRTKQKTSVDYKYQILAFGIIINVINLLLYQLHLAVQIEHYQLLRQGLVFDFRCSDNFFHSKFFLVQTKNKNCKKKQILQMPSSLFRRSEMGYCKYSKPIKSDIESESAESIICLSEFAKNSICLWIQRNTRCTEVMRSRSQTVVNSSIILRAISYKSK